MARRIEVRVRGRILLLFLLIAGLPLYVRYELHRVAKEVDTSSMKASAASTSSRT